MKNNLLFLSIFLVIFLAGFFWHLNKDKDYYKETFFENIKIAGQEIKIDLAVTTKEREKGLSGRRELDENQGMLFIFEAEGKYSFWMKDMNFPIDIIWINKDLRVVDIKKNATPESFPESFSSKENAKYVLEVFSGFSDKNNLREGEVVEFTY